MPDGYRSIHSIVKIDESRRVGRNKKSATFDFAPTWVCLREAKKLFAYPNGQGELVRPHIDLRYGANGPRLPPGKILGGIRRAAHAVIDRTPRNSNARKIAWILIELVARAMTRSN